MRYPRFHQPRPAKPHHFDVINMLSAWVTLLAKCGIFLGVIGFAIYFAHIKWVPDVQLNDSVFLAIASVNMLFVTVLGLLYGVITLIAPVWLLIKVADLLLSYMKVECKKPNLNKALFNLPFAITSLIVVLVIVSYLITTYSDPTRIAKFKYYKFDDFLIGFAMAGFVILVYFSSADWRNQSPVTFKSWISLAIVIGVAVAKFGSLQTIANIGMMLTGIRHQNAEIVLQKRAYRKVLALAKANNIALCVDDSQTVQVGYVLYGIDIDWHGVGAQTRLRFTAQSQNKTKDLALTVAKEDVDILDGEALTACPGKSEKK